MRVSPRVRKFAFAWHVTVSVGWVGAVGVFLAMAAIGLGSEDASTVRGVYLVMEHAAWLTLVPLAIASLATGIVISLVTEWGLVRHYWVVAKLVITVFATAVLLIYMTTFEQMAAVAANPTVPIEAVRNPSPVVHSILAMLVLLVAAVLGVYKPQGRTPFGRQKST